MKTFFFVLILLADVALAAPSDTKMMSCFFTRDAGGAGRADVSINSDGGGGLSARSLGETYLHLEFTRALSELGVIGLTEHVVAVAYTDQKGTHCQKGIDTRDVTCKENLGQIAVVTHRRDSQNVTHERKFIAQFDSVELISQRTEEGAFWMWEFVKEGKWAYTGGLSLWGCEYGTHHWDN